MTNVGSNVFLILFEWLNAPTPIITYAETFFTILHDKLLDDVS